MNRRTFLQGLLGTAGVPFFTALGGCRNDDAGLYWDFDVNFSGSVAVIGAGAAGLASGYLLDRYGIDYTIFEAAPRHGGRVHRAPDFADFPIDLGAEWIHEHPSVLSRLIDDPSVEGAIEVIPYSPDTLYTWHDGKLRKRNWASNFYSEFKFRTTTWYGFLDRYIAPASAGRILYDHPITALDTSGDQVLVTDAGGAQHPFDRVLITASMKVLQENVIAFTPSLPAGTADAIDAVRMPDGLKVFFEFDERFYPDIVATGPLLESSSLDKLFYDAAFRKPSSRHILALFCVNDRAAPYVDLDDEALAAELLAELDEMFDGAASRHHVKHVVQNWTAHEFVRGSYSHEFAGGQSSVVDELRRPVDGKVFFAGEALSTDNQATVPGAMQSGYAAVEAILKG